MERFQVSRCETKRVTTLWTEVSDGKQNKHSFTACRIGCSWPTIAKKAPFFFVVVGQHWDELDAAQGYVQLMEFKSEEISPEKFYGKLTDACEIYHANDVFVDLSEKKEEYADGFRTYLSKNRMYKVSLIPAPFVADFAFSVGILKDYYSRGMLDLLEKGECRSQLKSMTSQDLGESDLETKFYGVNALRMVLAGFHKYAPITPDMFYINAKSNLGYHKITSGDGWMAM